jgi:acetyl esterase
MDPDPDIASVVADIEALSLPPWHAMSPESARRVEDDLFSGEGDPALPGTEFAIPGPGGDLPVRCYRPAEEPAPLVVFFHGGGWTLGTLDSVEPICAELAARTGFPVLSVDYRLAPEHPFPAALEDTRAAVEWATEYGSEVGGDGRIAVGGTSAGGNLAAAATLWSRNEGPELAHQLLLYPVTDPSLDAASYRENASGPLLTRRDMAWFWDQYLRSPVDAHHPFAAVARADLAGVAPATVVTAGHDPLRDEGRAYAEKLAESGVSTTHLDYPAMCHGFLSLTEDVPAADRAMNEVCAALSAL